MQRNNYMRVCVIFIICVVGGFFVDNFGVFRFLTKESNTSTSGGVEQIKQQGSVNQNISSKLPVEVSRFLGKEMEEVKEQYQLEMDETGMMTKKDNVSMSCFNEDRMIDIILLNDSEGDHTLFGMKCNSVFNPDKIPSGYYFYDCEYGAVYPVTVYTRYIYHSQDEQKVLTVDCWQNQKIKRIGLNFAEEQSDSEGDGSSYENQEDDLAYGLYGEDDGYDSDYDDYDDEDDYGDAYILPYSDTTKLKKSDLRGLSKTELRLARNEIYARHGRRFLDASLQEYFDSQDWYYGYIDPEDFVDSEELSALEIRNAKFIQKFE